MELLYTELPLVYMILKALIYVVLGCSVFITLSGAAVLGCKLFDRYRR